MFGCGASETSCTGGKFLSQRQSPAQCHCDPSELTHLQIMKQFIATEKKKIHNKTKREQKNNNNNENQLQAP